MALFQGRFNGTKGQTESSGSQCKLQHFRVGSNTKRWLWPLQFGQRVPNGEGREKMVVTIFYPWRCHAALTTIDSRWTASGATIPNARSARLIVMALTMVRVVQAQLMLQPKRQT